MRRRVGTALNSAPMGGRVLVDLAPESFGPTPAADALFAEAQRLRNAEFVTMRQVALALSRATAPRRENWSWPARTPSMLASGGSEPVRAAFFRFLDTGEPYCTEDES